MENEFDDMFDEYEKDMDKEGQGEKEKAPGEKEGEEAIGDLDEFSKMMGVKPKSAAIISGLDKISLCSLLALCDIPADCFEGNRGSFALLDVSGRDPEKDAESLTSALRGLEVILAVNRDQTLYAKVYKEGKKKEKMAPPIALFGFPKLKLYLIGASSLSELKEGEAPVNSLSITKEEAFALLKQMFKN